MNNNRTTLHFHRIYPNLLAALLVSWAAPDTCWAQPAPTPLLVKAIDARGQSVLGELKTEEGDNLEVLEIKTGKRWIFQKSALNDLRKGITEREAAETIGLAEFLVWKVRRIIPSPSLAGKVAQIDSSAIYVTLGSQAGIEKDQELIVYRANAEGIKDPDAPTVVLGPKRSRIARLTVTEALDKLSKARLVGDLEVELKVGDVVEPANQSKPIAILPFVDLNGDVRAGGKKLEEDLTTGLAQGGVSIVERTFLPKVLIELGLQNTKIFDSEKAQRIGRQLGACAVLVGTLSRSGFRSDANLRLIKVETGEILFATHQNGPPLGDVVGSPATLFLIVPPVPEAEGKKPCCEATVDAGKKCIHKCCQAAAKNGNVCNKCHKAR